MLLSVHDDPETAMELALYEIDRAKDQLLALASEYPAIASHYTDDCAALAADLTRFSINTPRRAS